MTSRITRKYTKSVSYTGDTSFPVNYNRSYFFIVATDDVNLEFGKGGGLIPLGAGEHYAPPVCPTSEIDITSAGSYVIHSEDHNTI